MIRGTTPEIRFILPEIMPFDTLYITFEQNGMIVLEKTLDDVEIEDNVITLRLSQTDTLAFNRGHATWVQIRGKIEEMAYASQIMRVSIKEILKGGEI